MNKGLDEIERKLSYLPKIKKDLEYLNTAYDKKWVYRIYMSFFIVAIIGVLFYAILNHLYENIMIKLQKGEHMKYKINVIESKCGEWMFATIDALPTFIAHSNNTLELRDRIKNTLQEHFFKPRNSFYNNKPTHSFHITPIAPNMKPMEVDIKRL